MESENLIHVKLEYNEVFESKKDILIIQMNLLKVLKSIKEYKRLRIEELKLKALLSKKLKEAKTSLTKLKQILPHVKIPDFLKKDEIEEKIKETTPRKKEISYSGDLESQLADIQSKLKEMQR